MDQRNRVGQGREARLRGARGPGQGRCDRDELWLGRLCDDFDLHGRRGCWRWRRHPSAAMESDPLKNVT